MACARDPLQHGDVVAQVQLGGLQRWCLEVIFERREAALVGAVDEDGRALVEKGPDDRPADAARTSGDDHVLAVEPRHLLIPSDRHVCYPCRLPCRVGRPAVRQLS